jgi:hypothetical protein
MEAGQKLLQEQAAFLKNGNAEDLEKCQHMLQGILALSTKSSEDLRLRFINVCLSNHKVVQAHLQLPQIVMEFEPIAFRAGLRLLDGINSGLRGGPNCSYCYK